MNPKTFLALFLVAGSAPRAEVNLKYGAFVTSLRDIPVSVTYHSRSLYQGPFGFGWCADFEKRLLLRKDLPPQIQDCSSPRRPLRNFEVLQRSHNGYVLRQASEASNKIEKFDLQGRLIQTQSGTQKRIFSYDLKGRATGWRQGPDVVRIGWDSSSKYIAWLRSGQLNLTFEYLGGDLVVVNKSGRVHFRYRYDSLHNLHQIERPSAATEKIEYDTKNDLVIAHHHHGCTEKFRYHSLSENHKVSSVQRICDQQSPQLRDLHFWFARDHLGRKILKRTTEESGGPE